MMQMLEALRDALSAVDGVKTCKIGLEDNISPDDYPIIRIVPSKASAVDFDMDGLPVLRKVETLIYFGMPIQPFDDTPDADGRTRLEKLYAALFATEAAIITALTSAMPDVQVAQYLDTITDEDRLDTYKLMAVRCEVLG